MTNRYEKKKIKIFISTTLNELSTERETVARAIQNLHQETISIETFASIMERPSKAKVQESDVFIGVYGARYGNILPGEKCSATEIEFNEARKSGKDILIYTKADLYPEQKQKEFLRQCEAFEAGYFRRPSFRTASELEDWVKEDIAALLNSRFVTKYVLKEDTTYRRYCEYISQLYGYESFSGLAKISSGLQLPLNDIFVLPKLSDSNNIGSSSPMASDIYEIFRPNHHIVILGSPGIGKTTLLKFLAFEAAQMNLQSKENSTPLPILVPLSSYVSRLETDAKKVTLLEHIAQFAAERSYPEFLPIIREAINNNNALILLDGLDEIYNHKFRNQIEHDIETLAAQSPNLRIILTSRIAGFCRIEGFSVFEILPWNDDQIFQFITRWFAAFNYQLDLHSDSRKQAHGLMTMINQNNTLNDLTRIPLFLILTIFLYLQGYQLPKRRVELYDAWTKTFLETWDGVRSLSHTLGRPLIVSVGKKILRDAALRMMSAKVSVISRKELVEIILATIDQDKVNENEELTDIFTALTERIGLLIEAGVDNFSFIHLAFQEFFAAQAIANMPEKEAFKYITEHFYSEWHGEMIRLALVWMSTTQGRQEFVGRIMESLI